jgi:hypothetical protein
MACYKDSFTFFWLNVGLILTVCKGHALNLDFKNKYPETSNVRPSVSGSVSKVGRAEVGDSMARKY